MRIIRGKTPKKAVREVLSYFAAFKYSPSIGQIHTFMAYRLAVEALEKVLGEMAKDGEILERRHKYTGERMFVYPHMKGYLASREIRYGHTEAKLHKARFFFRSLSYIPWIHCVGISGSCAMHNADSLDDIDVFIISAPGGIWIARLSAILLAKLLHMHRKRGMTHTSDKICLNLFFDGSHLAVPKSKRNLYTAHEVVQVVPIVVRGGVYEEFIRANKWISAYFPNILIPRAPKKPASKSQQRYFFHFINKIAKRVQLPRIRKNQTSEFVSDRQLWFFPDDFEATIRQQVPIDTQK